MSVRYDDDAKSLALSVRDLVEEGAPRGDLRVELAQRTAVRLLQGRLIHQAEQARRGEEDAAYQAEVTLREQLIVDDWTVVLQGRVDGLTEEEGQPIIEEVKSTALDASRLYDTDLSHWGAYVEQLETYLWLLHRSGRRAPVGRLVLVSLLDGARHVLGVGLDVARVEARVRAALRALVRARERRIAWQAGRRGAVLPWPFPDERPGQREIVDTVTESLARGRVALVVAPTGLGKTAAVLHAALKVAFARGLQVYWATSRTTQQGVAEAAVRALAQAGLPVRSVTLTAREKACLNDVVACKPERCPFAAGYHDKVAEADLPWVLAKAGQTGREDLKAAGLAHQACPVQLAADVAPHADVVIGDYHYLFDPGRSLQRLFGETLDGWLVVVDEVHHLVDRAREAGSPWLSVAQARLAAETLAKVDGERFAAFTLLAREIEDAVVEGGLDVVGPARDGEAVVALDTRRFVDLADRVDELGLDYAQLTAGRPVVAEGQPDPWIELARATLRFAEVLAGAGEETVSLAKGRRGAEQVGLLCLDPSGRVGPKVARMAGMVGMSATLRPLDFFQSQLGLPPERLDSVEVGSPFPAENRKILVAPRVSTLWQDRAAHAEPTAALVQGIIEAVPGNVAVYFSSFAFARDIAGRWVLPEHEVRVQGPGLTEAERAAWLKRMAEGGKRVVLAAVLGGIFAEGIDLPSGALSAVVVVGPALPPVGLERDLLRDYYESRFGEGFRYASLVPGLTRVVQAAGRLVRRYEDKGVIVLVGRRFRWRDVAELLPVDWSPSAPEDVVGAVAEFYAGSAGGGS